MNEIQQVEQTNGNGLTVADPTGGRLVSWATAAKAAHAIATSLCQTSFAPKHFQNKPAEATAAIMFGDELGMSPTAALRSIYVVSGTPSLYARAMVALVLSHGHEIWTEEDTPEKVTVSGRRRGSDKTETITWTKARAKQAGYTSNAKYNSDPQAMLYARASGDVARRVAPDVLAGIAYTVEEMELQEQPTTTMHRDPQKRTAKRAAVPKREAPEPDLEQSAEPARAAITPEQSERLHAQLRDAGYGEREAGLAYVARQAGRTVETTNDLTTVEAAVVLDALDAELAEAYEWPETAEPPDPDGGGL